jgi:hypothetical protein
VPVGKLLLACSALLACASTDAHAGWVGTGARVVPRARGMPGRNTRAARPASFYETSQREMLCASNR